MKVLDSDFIIALLRKNPEVQKKLHELVEDNHQVATTILNAHEVMFGTIENPRNAHIADEFFRSLLVLSYNYDCMNQTMKIINYLGKNGERIGAFDEIIAGICKAHDATLITRNIKHFGRVPKLKVEPW